MKCLIDLDSLKKFKLPDPPFFPLSSRFSKPPSWACGENDVRKERKGSGVELELIGHTCVCHVDSIFLCSSPFAQPNIVLLYINEGCTMQSPVTL